MSFFKNIFSIQENQASPTQNSTLSELMSKIDNLPEKEAHYLISFSYLMARVAYADLDFSPEEFAKMSEILKAKSSFDDEKVEMILTLVKERNLLQGGTENYLVAREFYQISDMPQRIELLNCLFMVSAADDSISGAEEAELKKISDELKVSREDFVALRAEFREYRDVLKGMPQS